MSYQKLRVRKLTPRIGAEVFGVDLAQPLDNETFREIRDALLENQVIFFRDQDITIDQHKDFGRRFGELHIHPAAPSPEARRAGRDALVAWAVVAALVASVVRIDVTLPLMTRAVPVPLMSASQSS